MTTATSSRLREGNTPLLEGPRAAEYGGLARIVFKHQGFNPTGSFKDNGMTGGAAQARRLGMKRVACVSTGNTSASMAAYASAGGLDPLIFIPHGNISYGKLAQALEYGAKTFQVEANFDQILALVRVLAERLGIYLLNSINPFRIEGQKSIVIEMMDQRDWHVPDWIVLPGGNLGNVSAFGKGLREMHELGFIDRLPRLAVVQAEGASPFYEYMREQGGRVPARRSIPKRWRRLSRSAIRFPGRKRSSKSRPTNGVVETRDRAGDRGREGHHRAVRHRLRAGFRRYACRNSEADCGGLIDRDADVVAVLTGNVLKDPDYIYRYHTGQLKGPDGSPIHPTFGNRPDGGSERRRPHHRADQLTCLNCRCTRTRAPRPHALRHRVHRGNAMDCLSRTRRTRLDPALAFRRDLSFSSRWRSRRAVLTVKHPEAGGLYRWTRADFGPWHGFLAFWVYWTGIALWFPSAAMFYMSIALSGSGSPKAASGWSRIAGRHLDSARHQRRRREHRQVDREHRRVRVVGSRNILLGNVASIAWQRPARLVLSISCLSGLGHCKFPATIAYAMTGIEMAGPDGQRDS